MSTIKNSKKTAPPLPDRLELVAYLRGETTSLRRREIARLLRNKTPDAIAVSKDLSELRKRLSELHLVPRSGLKHQPQLVLSLDPPASGQIRIMPEAQGTIVCIVRSSINAVRVVPLSVDVACAGPRDFVLKRADFPKGTFLLEMFNTMWVRPTHLGLCIGTLTETQSWAIQQADRGINVRLPRGLQSVKTLDDEEFLEAWRRAEVERLSRYRVSVTDIIAEMESIAREERKVIVKRDGLTFEGPVFKYKSAAADYSGEAADLAFWESSRQSESYSLISTDSMDLRLSIINGYLYLLCDFFDKYMHRIENVTLSIGNFQVGTDPPEIKTATRKFLLILLQQGQQSMDRGVLSLNIDGTQTLTFEIEFR